MERYRSEKGPDLIYDKVKSGNRLVSRKIGER